MKKRVDVLVVRVKENLLDLWGDSHTLARKARELPGVHECRDRDDACACIRTDMRFDIRDMVAAIKNLAEAEGLSFEYRDETKPDILTEEEN